MPRKKTASHDSFKKGSMLDRMRLCGILDLGTFYMAEDQHGNYRVKFEVGDRANARTKHGGSR